ncbi:MAG: hypothetical protein DMG06_02360 [Acidobacteria bacterium]|nr:MAG: hypothetical protein DMG06_02360 [Acidobacteriota bacterium]
MIDKDCVIYKEGKGFCWCPSSAWNMADEELCQLCQVKNAETIEKIQFVNIAKPKTVSARQN